MKTLNKIILTGLVGLSLETTNSNAQYSQKGWVPVTEGQFNAFKIPEDSIQRIDLTKNPDSLITDNLKRGKIFIDRSKTAYFWFNPNPTNEANNSNPNQNNSYKGGQESYKEVQPKTSQESKELKTLTEAQELEVLMQDPQIKNLINDFNSSFQVRWRYYVLGEDIFDDYNGRLRKKGEEVFSDILKISKYQDGTILKDKKTSKEVLVIKRDKSLGSKNLECFLDHLSDGDMKFAISIQIPHNLKTLKEKKDFIRPYFTDSIPNEIKNLPKYIPPIIYKEEFITTKGKPVQYQNIKLDSAKPAKSVDMNEQILDGILKEE